VAQQLYEMITNLFCPQVASKMGFGDARKTFEKVRIQSPLQALRQTAGFPRTFSTHIKLCRAGQALQSAPPPSRVPPTGAPGSRRRAAGRATGRVESGGFKISKVSSFKMTHVSEFQCGNISNSNFAQSSAGLRCHRIVDNLNVTHNA